MKTVFTHVTWVKNIQLDFFKNKGKRNVIKDKKCLELGCASEMNICSELEHSLGMI